MRLHSMTQQILFVIGAAIFAILFAFLSVKMKQIPESKNKMNISNNSVFVAKSNLSNLKSCIDNSNKNQPKLLLKDN